MQPDSEPRGGRVLAIGDIHGCLTALQTLDRQVAFGADDLVITLGDCIDRGPDSKGVIDYLLELRKRTKLITLRGNHEVMMLSARSRGLDYFEAWLRSGGEQTMLSYGAASLENIPEAHWEFIESTRAIYETRTHFFVHANVSPHLPLGEQPDEVIYWERISTHEPPHCSGKIMVCGHTPQLSGKPLNLGHAVCIDTWVYGEGCLTCLDVTSGHYWQADQRGGQQGGRLENP